MSLHFSTESGAHYEVNGGKVRRLNDATDTKKRADGEWVRLHTMFPQTPHVGAPVVLVLEPLSGRGPDDYGAEGGGETVRRTTRVTDAWFVP